MNNLQLEINHCHAVCAELRAKVENLASERDDLKRQLEAEKEFSELLKIAITAGASRDMTVKQLCEAINLCGGQA